MGAGKRKAAVSFVDVQLNEGFALAIVWSKTNYLVNILSARVNGKRVVLDAMDDASPWLSGALPPPVDGKYTIEWAIVPKMAPTALAIAVVNLANGKRVTVAEKAEVKRNELWDNNEGVVVDAP